MCKDYAKKDGVIVKLFREAGAIFLVRGNCPQFASSIHTVNYIFGETKNPYDIQRSAGGSSGGNSALIAAHCVPYCLGSDTGGSLRYPAAFCGIYAFKPT